MSHLKTILASKKFWDVVYHAKIHGSNHEIETFLFSDTSNLIKWWEFTKEVPNYDKVYFENRLGQALKDGIDFKYIYDLFQFHILHWKKLISIAVQQMIQHPNRASSKALNLIQEKHLPELYEDIIHEIGFQRFPPDQRNLVGTEILTLAQRKEVFSFLSKGWLSSKFHMPYLKDLQRTPFDDYTYSRSKLIRKNIFHGPKELCTIDHTYSTEYCDSFPERIVNSVPTNIYNPMKKSSFRVEEEFFENGLVVTKHFYKDKLHRENGPAAYSSDGNYFHYSLHGETDRVDDGPAQRLVDYKGHITEYYYCMGRLHRINLPAIVAINHELFYPDRMWYLHGIRMSKEEFDKNVVFKVDRFHPTTSLFHL